jgi:hypothetical protein
MPRSEAYERSGNGRKTVGIRLKKHLTSERARTASTYTTRPSSLKVSDEIAGMIAFKESAYNVIRTTLGVQPKM